MSVGIYKILSPTGKVYIGQSHNIEKRLNGYKNNNCPNQTKLVASLKKHSFANHSCSIVYTLPFDVSQEVINEYEYFFYLQFKEAGYNLLNTREAFGCGGKHSQETKNKISAIHKGRKLSQAHREIISKQQKGSKRTEEAKRNIRAGTKGVKHNLSSEQRKALSDRLKAIPKEVRLKTYDKIRGVKRKPEHIAKWLATRKERGLKHSEETKKKLSLANIDKQTVAVIQKNSQGEVIEVFSSIRRASDKTQIAGSHICAALKTGKLCRGFKWEYVCPK